MQQINEKVMTDEETDCDDKCSKVLLTRMPPWHSKRLTKLMRTLDSRKHAKADAAPKKERKMGSFSDRSPPSDIPKWGRATSPSLSDGSSSSPVSTQVNPPVPSPATSPQCPPIRQSSTPLHSSTTRAPPRVNRLQCVSPIHTSSQANDSSSLESNVFSESESDDEMSYWIRAVTGLK